MRLRIAAVAAMTWLMPPAAAHAQELYFDSRGVRIHYVVDGAGEPVVLLHGLGGGIETWTATGILQGLAKDHRVIALDLRGHGRSGKPHDPTSYGREMGLDVIRLLDHLRIQKAHVVGYSLGGMLLSQLLTLYPERIATATLVAGPGRFGSSPASEWEQRARELEAECVSGSLIVALAPTDSPKPSDDQIRELSKECFADSTRDRFAAAALMRLHA